MFTGWRFRTRFIDLQVAIVYIVIGRVTHTPCTAHPTGHLGLHRESPGRVGAVLVTCNIKWWAGLVSEHGHSCLRLPLV